MILMVYFSEEKMHFYEFVKPIIDIAEKCGKKIEAKHYSEINQGDLKAAEKIILCGTSLKDFGYLKSLRKFSFLKKFGKPVLGICAGMHVLAKTFSCELEKCEEIGLQKIEFRKDFLGLDGAQTVYELHGFGVKDSGKLRENFGIFSKTKTVQAFRHWEKPFYGVLFHAEVRQKKLIENFLEI